MPTSAPAATCSGRSHAGGTSGPTACRSSRHENIGAGTIGAAALGALLSHPALVGLPAILEVPGGGQGARREDVAAARAAVALGIRLRQAS